MEDILWISACVPYDCVAHAGGKIANFYLKYLKKNSNYNIKLVSFYWEDEKDKIDLHQYGIEAVLLKRAIFGFPRTLVNLESFFNPFNRYAGIDQNYTIWQLKKALKKIKKSGFEPHIILLQWTEMLVLIDEIKVFFPESRIVGIEEDVKFLSFQRAYMNEKNIIARYYRGIRYRRLKQIELYACSKADKIVLNNKKDLGLLCKNGIEDNKLFVWCPYYEDKSACQYVGNTKNIIFYGAMGRKENYESAIWFIKNVFYKLEDTSIKFLIIGGNPAHILQKYASDRIKILGFVEDIGSYFQSGLCLVAPLLLGAGIKIKVLEAMSAGIPVLTNEIGIEGIPAESEREYIYCKSPQMYMRAINWLLNYTDKKMELSSNARKLVQKQFDLQTSADEFMKLIREM